MATIAGAALAPVPYYPTVSGALPPAPSTPTGGRTTIQRPLINVAPRFPVLTLNPSSTPQAPSPPAPADGPICSDGCMTMPMSPIPGATTGRPIPEGGNGMGAEGGKPGAHDDCSCGDLGAKVEQFLGNAPGWALVLVGVVVGAFVWKGAR